MPFDPINLDDINDPEELKEISKVLQTLSHYAKFKSWAVQDRMAGRIATALGQERQCEKFYNSLPQWARW